MKFSQLLGLVLLPLLPTLSATAQQPAPPVPAAAPAATVKLTATSAEEAVIRQAEAVGVMAPAQAATALQAAATPQAGPAIWFALGLYRDKAGAAAAAATAFRTVLDKLPTFAPARLSLAKALLKLEKPAEAAVVLADGLKSESAPVPEFWELFGYALQASARPVEAETAYRQALLLNPENGTARLGLIKAFLDQNRPDAARPMILAELARNPQQAALWNALANSDLATGKKEEAILHLECARRLQVTSPEALMLLGDLYLEEKLFAEAVSTYQSAAGEKLPPGRLLRSAEALLQLERAEEVAAVMKLLEPAIAGLNAGEKTRWRLLEARLANLRQDPKKAESLYRQLLADDPLQAEALLGLGELLRRNQNFTEARLLLDRASRQEGAKLKALLALVQVAVDEENYPQAVQHLEEACRLNPQPALADYLARLKAMGKKE